nr:S8 family peptidase [uncultured Hyphomonas sp.]
MAERNFLLGKGERLTEDVVVKSGGGPKDHPYSYEEAVERLSPMLNKAVETMMELPDKACPGGRTIASLTINPEYLAKSYFPSSLLRSAGVEAVGSKQRKITPAKRSRDRAPEEKLTTELFVMGKREDFKRWNESISNLDPASQEAQELMRIEEISAPSPQSKIKGELPESEKGVFEIVLHTDELTGEQTVLPELRSYLESLELSPSLHKRFYAGGLGFIELDAPVKSIEEIAKFSALRAVRQMPRLRVLRPPIKSASIPAPAPVLPLDFPINANIKAAIFDGGIPEGHPLTQWATPIETSGLADEDADFISHGVGVTSAFLFGHISPGAALPRPYCYVDHYRVLDTDPGADPHELYEVLDRIDAVLSNEEYDIVNLSLGPCVPIEDDDVHAWTAVLDDRFGRTDTLAGIAVGNDGEGDELLGLNRVQVPSDCVNALAIGACDSRDKSWARASYSSVGPGRSPGIVKPDLVDFGGALDRPFLTLGANLTPTLETTGGTSFSTPSVMRAAAGILAHFETNISALATRALLVHGAECNDYDKREVGWGRIPQSLDDIVICDDDTVRIVYQGSISPAKYQRVFVPMPDGQISGKVDITATLCYKSRTDPHHPGNYTQAGLEVSFRPHDQKFSRAGQLHPDTKSFFGKNSAGLFEDEQRRDAWKWENCLHDHHKFMGKSLKNPCFDIHYNSRLEGRDFRPDVSLPYAMIISVKAKSIGDLYDQVVRKYATRLEPIRPSVEIPVRT